MSEYTIDKIDFNGNTYKIDYSHIPYGTINANSTSTIFNATVDGITELSNGVCAIIKNGIITSASGCTLNVNSLGAKPIYNVMAETTQITTEFNKDYTALFIYNTIRVSTGCWDMYCSYGNSGSSSSFVPYYGGCSTAAGTAAKTVTISGIDELTVGLTIMVKFTNANSKASPTLKVNNLDAKPIMRYGTTAPGTNAAASWNAGSVVILVYDGTYWQMCNFLNSTYTLPSAMTESEMKAGTGSVGRTLTAAKLKEAVEYHSPVPAATASDAGKSLKVDSNGDWAIADILAWNLLGEYTGIEASSPQVPNGTHEALVVIEPSTGYRLSFVVPISDVYFSTTNTRYLTNNYSSDYNGWTRFDLNRSPAGNNYINLNVAYSGNINVTSTAKWWIFYR